MTQALRSLRQAARHGMVLSVSCFECKRSARYLATDVASVLNPGTAIEQLPFKCKTCGRRADEIKAAEFEPDRAREIIVWRPTRLR